MNDSMRFPFLDLADVNAPYMDEMAEAAARVIRSGRYIGGDEVETLETDLCRLTGARYCVAVSNGLDALRLILRAYVEMGRLQRGDEVIVPGNTYIASVLAISDAGLVAVPVDPCSATSVIDPEAVEKAIGPRTRAVMPVHLYGRVAIGADLQNIVHDHNLLVIEDNAQAIGARNALGITGALGDAAAFSFYPTKNIGALGDAGAVTTSDGQLAATVRAIANYGSDRRYHNIMQGFNCRMDSLQAALLRVKLAHIEEENAYRCRLAEIYDAGIDNPLIHKPPLTDDCVWHQYVVVSPERDRLQKYLTANGVGSDIHYPTPPHLQPCYQGGNSRMLRLPDTLAVTEELARSVLSLPITRTTTTSDAHTIAEILSNFR